MTGLRATQRTRRHQAGISMIEVLVAILVVSIGFLGMAALQAKAMSTNNSAMARSLATVASYSILDAMRVDRANAAQYVGTVTADNCPAAGATLASYQLNAWCTQLGTALGALPTTTGTVACTNTDVCTVTIQFDDSHAGAGGSAQQQIVTVAAL